MSTRLTTMERVTREAERAIGASMAYSMMTRYELGMCALISMKPHLILDAVSRTQSKSTVPERMGY